VSELEQTLVLKLSLATRGVRVDRTTAAFRLPLESTPSVELVLPSGLRVGAPIVTSDSEFVLVKDGGFHYLVRQTGQREERIEVRAVPVPRFLGRTTTKGIAMSRLARIHGGHLLVHPGAPCGFSVAGTPCAFCREGARSGLEVVGTVADVVEVTRVALEEGLTDFVYFNTSLYEREDGGLATLIPYIEGVRRHFDTMVAVQAHPPADVGWVDRAYAAGVDALSFNLEIFDPDVLDRNCIGRARYIGRERYLEALTYAATIFPSGTVWSDLVLGVEPLASTRAGIDALVDRGVVPVLSVRAGHVPPEPELAPVLRHLFETVRGRGITMGWIRDLAVGIAPLEARSAADDDARLAVAVQSFTRSRFGALAARGLARFRRRLRVRNIGESFDASHL
jgi:hypothetical protein